MDISLDVNYYNIKENIFPKILSPNYFFFSMGKKQDILKQKQKSPLIAKRYTGGIQTAAKGKYK